jgi:hypothetical protein
MRPPLLSHTVVALGLGLGLAAAAVAPTTGRAATPSGGTIDGSAPVSWDFAAVGGGTPTDSGTEDTCPPVECDNFDLTVNLPTANPKAYYGGRTVTLKIRMTWDSPSPNNDLDIFVFSPDDTKYGPGKPDTATSGANEEDVSVLDPVPGVYHVRSVAATTIPTAAHAVATMSFGARLPLRAEPAPRLGEPGFGQYMAPPDLGNTAFEPSIGSDWKHSDAKTDVAMYLAYEQPLRVTFDDSVVPPKVTWTDVTSPFTSPPVTHLPVCPNALPVCRITGSDDPILWTDHETGRTIVSQLQFYAHCSQTAFSDDDGQTWLPSPKPCGTPSGLDHQTVGGGPFAPPLPSPGVIYPNAVYYCSQELVTAFCSLSVDGGMTFGVGVPLYLNSCGGIHGHVKVSPDGTVYVPNLNCPDSQNVARQAVVVSPDNGLSWTAKLIPDSQSSGGLGGDPSVGIGAGNTVYFGYVDADGHPKMAVSKDHGDTWTKSVDLGRDFFIQNAEFPEVVAGDDDRAAFAFYGTPTPGNDQDPHFPGVWHLFVAMTYDGGKTWTTVDTTRGFPIQRGCIWNGGGSNRCRNIDDFVDATIDKQGRVLVGYSNGCADAACMGDTAAFYAHSHKRTSKAEIARLECGRSLFAADDPGARNCPAAAGVAAAVTSAPPPPAATPVTAVTPQLPNTAGSGGAPAAAWGASLSLMALVRAGRQRARRRFS